MYYNLTEDQKVFYATSYSLLKAGYTSEEIVEFWSNDNEEEIEFILESLEYVDIDRKDPDFIELIDEGLFSWGARLIAPITNAIRGARTARQLSQLRRIAQMTNPSAAQRAKSGTSPSCTHMHANKQADSCPSARPPDRTEGLDPNLRAHMTR